MHDYPDRAGAKHKLFYGVGITGTDYDELVKPFGEVGIRVRDAAALKSALKDGYAAVSNGKTVIVNVLL